ncbi:MAG: hypothetical protein PHX93_03095 [Candidatus Peribacteraceae bacterium]|jgi:hypothetical protein|nr:hypothetical protein [Candidatus Peribacteraceae bacterium]
MSPDISPESDPLQNELHRRLVACRPGDPEVASYAYFVKQHCGYLRSDVRNLLCQRGLGHIEGSDATDTDWVGEAADSAADLADK